MPIFILGPLDNMSIKIYSYFFILVLSKYYKIYWKFHLEN
jgi:hypothetical protein